MKNFIEKVDRRSRDGMIDYLSCHQRYDTMNSCNNPTSYAHNVKIRQLGISDKAYDVIETRGFWDMVNELICEFDFVNDYRFQAGFNGRSGGYLVLYRGGYKFKTLYEFNGQRSNQDRDYADIYGWLTKEEAIEKGVYKKQIKKGFINPGREVDQCEDFIDWEISDIRERVKLIQEFDRLAQDILELLVECCKGEVVEKVVYDPRTVKVLQA